MFRVAIGYFAAAWVAIEVAATVLPPLGLPDWALTVTIIAALLGLPIVLVLSWVFDFTEEGLQRTGPVVAGAPSLRFSSRVAIGFVLLVGLAGVGAFAFRHVHVPDPEGERITVAIFPFRETGGDVAGLGEGLADLLSTALDGTPGLTVPDPWGMWRPLRPEHGAPAHTPAASEAAALAEKAGADLYLLGGLLSSGERLEATVRLFRYDAAAPLHSFSVSGSPDSVGALTDRLAVEIISRVGAARDPAVAGLAARATANPDALKSYLAARAARRRGMVDSADAAIDRALAADSAFSLALVEAVHVKSWTASMRGEFYRGLLPLAERAVHHAPDLDERNRLRALAMLAAVRTDGLAAYRAASRLLELDSADVDAWSSLSWANMVYGWQYGADEMDALSVAERLLALDSTDAIAAIRRTWFSVALEDSSGLRRAERLLAGSDTTSLGIRGALLGTRALLAPGEEFPVLLDVLVSRPHREWISALRYLRVREPGRAERLLSRLRERAAPGPPRSTAIGEEARLWIAEGRTAEVMQAVERGDYRENELYEHLYRFIAASRVAGVGDPVAADKAIHWLARYITPDSALHYFETRPVWWTGWLVAAYHAGFGDTTVTRRWHEAIAGFPEGGTSLDYREGLRADLEARLAARRGDLEAARSKAEEAIGLWSIHTENDWEALPAPAMRFNLAMLHRALGDPQSARGLLRSLVPPTSWMGFLTVRASYELAEIAEEEGDLEEAARHYLIAIRYWERGGPEVAHWLERARDGLRRVAAEDGRAS